MIPGFTTWEQVGSIDDNVLLIVNSRRHDEAEVTVAYRELEARAPRTLHVVAEQSWREWMTENGVDAGRTLYASDENGDIELNHFLETSIAIRWIVPKQFRLVAGTAAHSPYNEEVKDIFEQRVGLFLRDGYLLAHALPERGLYAFDLAALLHRLGREPRRQAYQAGCRALIDDLHRIWREQGSPGLADDPDWTDVVQVLSRHLGPAVLTFDERNAIPLNHGDDIAGPAALLVSHLEDVIYAHDDALASLVSHLQDVVHARDEVIHARDELLAERAEHLQNVIRARDELLAERNEAVVVRDAIIAELRSALDTPVNRFRRRLSEIVRPR